MDSWSRPYRPGRGVRGIRQDRRAPEEITIGKPIVTQPTTRERAKALAAVAGLMALMIVLVPFVY